MSRRDRRVYLSSRAPLVAVLLCWPILVATGQPSQSPGPEPAEGEGRQGGAGTDQQKAALPSSKVAVGEHEQLKPYDGQASCDRPNERSDYDTCSQRRSALAAETSARLNWHQVVAAYIGAGLGFFAAVFTGWAAFAAAAAARAAQQSVNFAENTGKRQLRAYLTIDGARASCISTVTNIKPQVVIKNVGQTPAYSVRACVCIENAPRSDPPPITKLVPFISDAVIGPGSSIELGCAPIQLTVPEFEAVRSGGNAIFVWGRVEYKDVFGQLHYLTYRDASLNFRSEPNGPAWFDLSPTEAGNEAD